ncbi:porin [Hyphomicrobium sp.]|uniref:porin n=1 Tax=Hyphomicrobium sp. TaxID=82 RepID=UPI002D7A3510|nr:porin [Hyphomicrobium sp.]HET6388391.1 porin [Hyphomicrobium sp.]
MKGVQKGLAVAGSVLVLLSGSAAYAGQKFQLWDEDSWISIGAGLRASYVHNPDAIDENDFALNSARIYANGQFTKIIGFTYNTEIEHDFDHDGDISRIRTMDAILRLEFNPAFNVWGGRMLPPSDRSNLNGPYYLGTWEYPFVSAYPQIFQGRDNGGAVWGDIGKFKYEIGGFQGCTSDRNSCDNPDASGPLVAGRFQYDFWDKESGYYTSSDYYGDKEMLSVGLVGQFQSEAATNGFDSGDFKGFNIDVLMQKRVFSGDVLTLEGAFYVYDTSGINTALATGNGLADGHSYFVLASYLINQKIGIGKFQPVIRFQEFDQTYGPDISEVSLGTNYIIKGHDARLSALYSRQNVDNAGNEDINRFVGGLQLQF